MHFQFKGTNYECTPEMTELAEKKLATVARILTNAQAHIELERVRGAQKTGDVWRAEITLMTPEAQFRAESTKAKLDHAIHTAAEDVTHAVRRAKRHNENLFKKGGAAVKDFLRGFRRE